MKKTLVAIDKIHILLDMILNLETKDPKVTEIVRFIQFEILKEDQQNINEIKRMIYKNMMTEKEKGNLESYAWWYESYQKIKKEVQ